MLNAVTDTVEFMVDSFIRNIFMLMNEVGGTKNDKIINMFMDICGGMKLFL